VSDEAKPTARRERPGRDAPARRPYPQPSLGEESQDHLQDLRAPNVTGGLSCGDSLQVTGIAAAGSSRRQRPDDEARNPRQPS